MLISLAIKFYILAFVFLIGGIYAWKKKINTAQNFQIVNGIDRINYVKALGIAFFGAGLFTFMGASVYLLLGEEWLWLSFVLFFIGVFAGIITFLIRLYSIGKKNRLQKN